MFVKSTQDFDIWMEIQFKFLHFLFNTTYTFEPIIPFQLNFIINYSNILKCVNLIEIQFLYAYFYTRPFLVFWHIMFDTTRAPDKLRICIFYAMKTSKNTCIIRSECTHYAYILLCKQTFQIRSVLVVVYITVHFCLWEIPRNYFPLYFSKERAYTSEGYRMSAFLSIDVKRDLIGCLR
jgi:hypothetical protein